MPAGASEDFLFCAVEIDSLLSLLSSSVKSADYFCSNTADRQINKQDRLYRPQLRLRW